MEAIRPYIYQSLNNDELKISPRKNKRKISLMSFLEINCKFLKNHHLDLLL